MTGNDEDRGRSRRLGAEDQGWLGPSWVLGGWAIGRSGDTVSDPHHTCGEDEMRGFSGLASKPVAMVCQWFGPQNQGWRFGDLVLKIIAMISWFGPQNHVGGGLSVCVSKPMNGWRRCEDMRQHLVACFVRKEVGVGFPSFASKLVEQWHRVVHVTSSQRSRRSEAKDGQFDGVGCGVVEVKPNYPSLVAIFLLAHRGIPVF
jgi:hypothetical protein